MTFFVFDSGQSNATGARGGGPNWSGLSSRILAWNKQSDGQPAPNLGDPGNAWVTPTRGQRPYDRGTNTNCAGLWMCSEIAEALSCDVRHLMVARGGLTIESFRENTSASYDMYSHIRTVFALSGARPADLVKWHQGESDGEGYPAATPKNAYKDRFLEVLAGWMTSGIVHPNAPVLLCGLADQNARTIDEALQELGSENEGFYYVPIDGLAVDVDGIHFTGQGLYDLGLRCWDIYRGHLATSRLQDMPPGAYAAVMGAQQKLFNQLPPYAA